MVRRNIPTGGNLTSASFTMTPFSVFAHPGKLSQRQLGRWGCLGECF